MVESCKVLQLLNLWSNSCVMWNISIKPLLQECHIKPVLFAFHHFTKWNKEILLNFDLGQGSCSGRSWKWRGNYINCRRVSVLWPWQYIFTVNCDVCKHPKKLLTINRSVLIVILALPPWFSAWSWSFKFKCKSGDCDQKTGSLGS